ncbi:MAG: winged helix-turn-helix domain-containing protein [candidate division KSB1 bacterium]|nr:winged helix-turn-helix domain-containing protein [candidate division KSB1 bacterium]MDZ7301580.1 winged helix-turn-helix domain-containing protein [candidate division KSB1 bacterium]MDZ7311004.1 winged helix-turn-helix domain-containing protein [candidate division KSB1 bacterium]
MTRGKTQVAGYRFDDIYLDIGNRQLWRSGQLVPLSSKYFDVLLLLLRHRGQLVEKQRIFDEVWNGVIVTDAALTQCIKEIRKQLGDHAANPRYIKTVPKHGYIFIGHAVEAGTEETPPLASQSSISPVVTETGARRPYKFLDYYTEQDAPLFFGRESEIETICSQILAHRSFILHGRSGVGKSSIVRAGLMPRLKTQGHLVFTIRSFTDPLQQMVNALLPLTAGDGAPESASKLEDLVAVLEKNTSGHPIIFFLDQFEDFFLLLTQPRQQQFIDTIGKLFSNDARPFRLVFVLREDLLAEMSQFKSVIPEIFHHEYRLMRLSREQASRAITEPAKAAGCRYEAELVTRLLNDLSDADGVDPPQLQIVCDQLYDARSPEGKLTAAIYDRLGTASQILAGYLGRVLRHFKSADLRVAKEILKALISSDGQRLVLRIAELNSRLSNRIADGEAKIHAIVEELVAARVVRCRNQDGEGWLELAHDFLLPEVSRWLTDEELSLKRARGVLERALENFRIHQLIIDDDALDLLLPFGEQLGLSGEEADLLAMSVLHRARPLPQWLVRTSPSLSRLVMAASQHADPNVRLCVIEACRGLRHPEIKDLLRRMSLWDRALMVRKAASIALADWFGQAAGEIVSNSGSTITSTTEEKSGLIRRVVSLALIRDYDRHLLPFSRLPLYVSVMIVLALIWVRLRREWNEIIRQGISGTLGGAAAGIIGGFMLGLALATVRHATALEAISLMLVLISLGLFISALGGFGVSFGMVAAAHLTYRHGRWWSVIGGAVGGAVIAWSAHLVGVDTLQALFGCRPTEITGAFEGGVIGVGVSLGAVLTGRLLNGGRPWQRILGAAGGGFCAGILLTAIGGNLFSASLELIARSFANSQIRLEPLATFFGEVHFGRTSQIALGAMEGLLFGGCLMGGMEFLARHNDKNPTRATGW